MHGLLKAGLLLAPALAGGVGATASPQDNKPSAFISLDVPGAGLKDGTPFLSFRLDVKESANACGTPNVTINGEPLPDNGQVSLPLDPDCDLLDPDNDAGKVSDVYAPSAVVRWDTDCVSWGGQEREQLMRLRIVSVNGVEIDDKESADNTATIRFQQTAPARVLLVDGAASVFQFSDGYFVQPPPPPAPTATSTATVAKATGKSKIDSDDNDDSENDDSENDDNFNDRDNIDPDLVAWENSLMMLHRSAALLHHDIHLRERYIVQRFGPDASRLASGAPGFGPRHRGPCSDITSFIGSVFHKVSSTAKSIYGDLVANAFGDDHPHHRGTPHGVQHGTPGFPMRTHCFPGYDRQGAPLPPPPPPPPAAFLFHCPPPPPEGFPGQPFPPKHLHGPSPPDDAPHDGSNGGSPVPPGPLGPPHGGPHGGPSGGPDGEGPFWMASKHGADAKGGEFRGRKMHGHGPDGPPPPADSWDHGRNNQAGPGGFLGFGGAPMVKTVAFFALVIVLLFVFTRHCRNRRIEQGVRNRRANGPRGFRGFAARFQAFTEEVQERDERRQARRERRRQRRASMRGFFRSVRRFLFAGEDDDEKVTADANGATSASERPALRTDGHIVMSVPPSRSRSPAPSLEDEIAQFRVAADVVDQIIAAEEGRIAVAQTAASRRRQQQQQDEDLERAMRSVSPGTQAASPVPTAVAPSLPPASTAPYNQRPPPPPPPPSMANSSSVYGGYGRRDAAGMDSDDDDVESLPPAYSSDDYQHQYANLVESSVVADGFQYRPGSSN